MVFAVIHDICYNFSFQKTQFRKQWTFSGIRLNWKSAL